MVYHNNLTSPSFFKKKPVVIIISILAVSLTSVLVVWLNLTWRPDVASLPPDSGFYAYVGKAILNRQVLYRDVWDDKPPLGYYLNAMGQAVFGQTPWGVWWSSIAWILGCTVLLFLVIRKLFGKFTAGIASAIFLMALMSPQIFQGGNLMEVYGLAPQIGVIGISYLFFTKNRNIWLPILAGVLTACAFLIKQPNIILGCASIFVMTISSISESKFREAVRTILGFMVGAVGLMAIVSLYWVWIGAWGELISGAIFQGISFVGDSQSHLKENFFYTLIHIIPNLRIGSIYLIAMLSAGFFLLEKLNRVWLRQILKTRRSIFEWCMLAAVAAIPLAGNLIWPSSWFGKFWIISIFSFGLYIWVRFARIRPRPEFQPVFSSLEWVWLIAVVSLPLELLMVSLVGGNAGHYFITMIPSIVLAIAYPIYRVVAALTQTKRALISVLRNSAYAVLTVLVLIWGAASIIQDLPSEMYRNDLAGIFRGQSYLSTVEQYILQTTQPDDEVLVWHIHLGINFVTDRKAPARFLFPLNLFIPPNKENAKLEEYVNALELHLPELILVQKPSSMSVPFVDDPLEAMCNVYCNPEFEQALEIPQIRQEWLRLQQFFYSHYGLDQRIYDWTVYRKLP